MKAAENPFGALWREVALDVRNDQNQNTQQHHDLDHIVEKELNAAAEPACRIQTADFHNAADCPVQPFHSQDFILKKVPNTFE